MGIKFSREGKENVMDISPVDQALGTTGSSVPVRSEPNPEPVSDSQNQPPPEAPLREYQGNQVDTTA